MNKKKKTIDAVMFVRKMEGTGNKKEEKVKCELMIDRRERKFL